MNDHMTTFRMTIEEHERLLGYANQVRRTQSDILRAFIRSLEINPVRKRRQAKPTISNTTGE